MQFVILAFLLATCRLAQARQNGDPLNVGEEARIRVLVEVDYHLILLGCGEIQCGGVRVDGLDPQGMGFRTFISYVDDRLRAKWIVKEDFPFGTSFSPGKEFIFHVLRSAEQQMLVWVEGKENRKASVKVGPGTVRLTAVFKKGIYQYLSNKDEFGSKVTKRKELCKNETRGAPVLGPHDDVLEVSIGCRYNGEDKLRSMCIVYLAVDGVKGMQEIYRSSLAHDDYDPQLEATVKLPFRFHEQQNLVFAVYGRYLDCGTPPDEDLRGTMQTPLAAVNRKRQVELSISDDQVANYLVKFALNCDEKITLGLSAKDIPGKSNVYLKITKSPTKEIQDKNSGYVWVAETNKVSRDIGLVTWDEMTLSVKALCDGDHTRPLKVYALEDNNEGSHLIGYFETTLTELKQPKNSFVLINNTKDNMGGSHKLGIIFTGEIPRSPTFSQYVSMGFDLLGTLQIDFTASNDAAALHDVSSHIFNKYEVAIQGVGEVVEKFVSHGVFKAYGFGATLPGPKQGVLYDFHVNISSSTPDCSGVKGVLKAYRECVPQISTSGPTYAAPGLRKVIDIARKYQDGSKYLIHVLLTDGLLDDVEETKQAILEASNLPISIIIVGIGDANFGLLESIATHSSDASSNSTVKFWNEGERGARDIVQFAAIREFQQIDDESLKSSLRQHVLAKIPPQYLEYMKIRKIPPKPPKNSTITREC